MKKTVFAVLSFIIAAVMIISAVSCAKAQDAVSTDAETKANAAETAGETDTAPEETTDEITTAEAVTEEITTEEITTGEVTAEEITEAETAEETVSETSSEAYRIYKDGTEKTNALPDIKHSQSITQDITMTILGEEVKTLSVIDSYSEIHDRSGSDMKCHINQKVTSESGGTTQSQSAEVYADSDKIYYNDGISGLKVIDRSDPNYQTVSGMIKPENMMGKVLSTDVFKNASVTENSDGSKTIKATPENEVMNDAFEEAMAQYRQMFSTMGAENIVCTAGGSEISFTVSSDGYIVHSESRFIINLTMEITGIPLTAVSDATTVIDIIDPGQPVTVEMP